MRLLRVMMVLAMILAACGGDDSTADPVVETTTTAESVVETTATAPSGDVGGEQGAVGAGTEFCNWILTNTQDDTDYTDPVATKESTLRDLAEAEKIRSVVPSEVAADFDVVYQMMVGLGDALAAHDYNLFAVPEETLEQLAPESTIEASENISDYCGAGL